MVAFYPTFFARAVVCTTLLLLFSAVPRLVVVTSAFQVSSSPFFSTRSAAPSTVVRIAPPLNDYRSKHYYAAGNDSSSSNNNGRAAPLRMSDVAAASSTESGGDKEKLFEGFGVGIARDLKARIPLLKSDITDGFNVQCLAATMFLFFACLAPAVGFGGLFALSTGGAIGTVEMVTSTAACGMLYAMFSAQPLTIIGSTGPVLAFVACLAQLAKSLKLPFLPLYTWTGLWTAGILLASSLTSASNLVKYLTRFTDEIFSTLISAIFVVEAVSDVARTFASPSSTFTKALLTVICATTTFVLSTILKKMRRSVFFMKTIRNTISNFAPTIGVVSAALLARWARLAQGTKAAGLPTLTIPDVFGTTSGRPWLVPLMDLPVWARWASILPALMATGAYCIICCCNK